MKYDQLTVVLPCQTLESLSLERSADEADQLLSAWTALFHPALVASASGVAGWFRAEEPSHEVAGHLIVLPECCESLIPDGWLEHAETQSARLIRGVKDRGLIVARALESLEGGNLPLDPGLVADFHALGLCNFHVELLTRQLRYMSNLDSENFRRRVVDAAEALLAGNLESSRSELQGGFDLLTEAREYFYPVETHLLDLILVAESTLGESLRAELDSPGPKNMLLTGALAERLAREEPESLAKLKAGLEKGDVRLVGGEWEEKELPLLTPESILDLFRRGREAYDAHLGSRPTIFGRRRFGLWPTLPQILNKLGFAGALHFTLDDGRFPTSNQSKIRWEGIDGTAVEALARVPVNASQSDALLALPRRLGDAMDLDHAATMVFAHWPDHVSPWYRDLQRMSAYSPVLGRFATVSQYFDSTQLAGKQSSHSADEYRTPYLRQAIAVNQIDPISRWARYYRRRVAGDALAGLVLLAGVLDRRPQPYDGTAHLGPHADPTTVDVEDPDPSQVEAALAAAGVRLSQLLSGSGEQEVGYWLANPFSFSRQIWVETPELPHAPSMGGPVRASSEADGRRQAIVDVPAMGFAWVGPGETTAAAAPARKRRKQEEPPPLAEENLLRNEFFELKLNPTSGGIQSIFETNKRGNRLGQQIAMRLRPAGPGGDAWNEETSRQEYSLMAADEIRVTSPGPLLGETVSRGRLVDREGQQLATFRQTTQVRRGSPVVRLEIELDIQRLPEGDPWNSYYAVRFAWPDEAAVIYRSVGQATRSTEAVLMESPHFVDIRAPRSRTTLLAGGLPFHRRIGMRMLDTLLVVAGERARTFHLGIGVGLVHPLPAALDMLAPSLCWPTKASPPGNRFGWLFHIDAKNVVATHFAPLSRDGRVAGYRVRLLETEGRRTPVGIRSIHAVRGARKVDFQGELLAEVNAEGDRVSFDMGPHDWVEIEVEFSE